jgi:hypothetical protein
VPSSLRPSQIETLKAVQQGELTNPRRIAIRLGREEHSTEQSLIRLTELGYLTSEWFAPPLGFSQYRLTNKGREAIERG